MNESKFWNQIEIWEMLRLATRSGQGPTKSSDQILVPDKNVLPTISKSMRRMRPVCFFNKHAYKGKFCMLLFFNFLEDLEQSIPTNSSILFMRLYSFVPKTRLKKVSEIFSK